MKKLFNIIVSVIMAASMIVSAGVTAKAEVEDYAISDIVASAKKVDDEGTKCMRVLHVEETTYRVFLWKENNMLYTDVWHVNKTEDPWDQLVDALDYLMALGDPE